MALSDLSFKLYTDSGLTTPFGGTLQLTHNTDLSDNPQDFTFYFGSTDATKKLQANSNPGTDQITLTPTDTIATWTTAHGYIIGDTVEPTSPNGKVYKCTTAGTSHASVEPSWPTSSIGSTVSDGTCVWTLLGAKHATTEIKLALTGGGLGAATPGAALNLGTEIDGSVGDAIPVHMRVTNAVTNVRNDTGHAEIGIYINTVIETAI